MVHFRIMVICTGLFCFFGGHAHGIISPSEISPLYREFFNQGHVMSFKVDTRISSYVNERGEEEYSEENEFFKVDCRVDEVAGFDSGVTGIVECTGDRKLISGRYLATPEGLWEIDTVPENDEQVRELSQGDPWLNGNPKLIHKKLDSGCMKKISMETVSMYGGITMRSSCIQETCPKGRGGDAPTLKVCFLPGQGPVVIEDFLPTGKIDFMYTARRIPDLPEPPVHVDQSTLDRGRFHKVLNLISQWAAAQNQGDYYAYARHYADDFHGEDRSLTGKTGKHSRKNWLQEYQDIIEDGRQIIVRDLKVDAIVSNILKVSFTRYRRSFSDSDKGRVLMDMNLEKGTLSIVTEKVQTLSPWDGRTFKR
ncbi:hypothetical protein ACFL6N_03575 [Thermodesulfobacteriota bacterium]